MLWPKYQPGPFYSQPAGFKSGQAWYPSWDRPAKITWDEIRPGLLTIRPGLLTIRAGPLDIQSAQ